MASVRATPSSTRINVLDDHQVRIWALAFGVSQATLRGAIRAVGPEADKVRRFISGEDLIRRPPVRSERRPAGSKRS